MVLKIVLQYVFCVALVFQYRLSWIAYCRCQRQQRQPQEKRTRLYTVNKVIGQRESEEGGREYLLDWAESWECKSGVFQRPKGRVKKTKPRPEKVVGRTGGDKVEGLGTINNEVALILEVEPSGLGRCYKVRWTPTWTSELECPVTYVLQWRIEQKQKQRVEVKEEEEEEMEDDEDSEEERGELCGMRELTVAKRSSMLAQAMPSTDHAPGMLCDILNDVCAVPSLMS